MKVSEFIHLLKHLPPDIELFNATGSSWGELDLMDEDSRLQCYVGKNPDGHNKTALIFYNHHVDCKGMDDWIPLKDHISESLIEEAAIKIIATFLSEDPRWADGRPSYLSATAADMIRLAKLGEDWKSLTDCVL